MATLNVDISGPERCGKTQLATQLILMLARNGHTNVQIADEGESSNDTRELLKLPKDTLVVIRTSTTK